eukprot:5091366-Pleurochrysis_carterae.AAC.1
MLLHELCGTVDVMSALPAGHSRCCWGGCGTSRSPSRLRGSGRKYGLCTRHGGVSRVALRRWDWVIEH